MTAFPNADRLIVTDIYAASEEPIPGVSAAALADGIRRAGHRDVQYIGDFKAIVEELIRTAQPSDVILTLGAGNVLKIGEAFLNR